MLRGPAFDQVWPNIENSLGLDRIPEPARTLVLETRKVNQGVVLGYWDQVLSTEPAELQAWIDGKAAGIQIPCLAVFGRSATDGERERLGRLPDAQIRVPPRHRPRPCPRLTRTSLLGLKRRGRGRCGAGRSPRRRGSPRG
jgi:hypothetical protein